MARASGTFAPETVLITFTGIGQVYSGITSGIYSLGNYYVIIDTDMPFMSRAGAQIFRKKIVFVRLYE